MEKKAGSMLLHRAVKAGQWAEVLLELQQGADVNAVDDKSSTPLHLAIGQGAPAHIVRRLISKKNVNMQDKNKFDANPHLVLCCVNGCYWDHLTPLHVAIRYGAPFDICTELITPENVNMQDDYGLTPLHWAAWTLFRNWNLLSVLIQHGADINLRDNDNDTPLQVVVAEEEIPPLEILMQLISERNINNQDRWGVTALHRVSENKRWDLVPVLLQHGADVNLAGEECDKTPLHLAIEHDAPTDIVIQLMSAQNVNMTDCNGHTPLHRAASEQKWELVTILLQHGADPTKVGGFRRELSLKDLCIVTLRGHMTTRTDEALESMELPRDLMPEMKMKGLIQQFVAWWKHRMVVQEPDGPQ